MKIGSYLFTVEIGMNRCLDIRSTYSVYQYNRPYDIYCYGYKDRKFLKRQYGLTGLVDDHLIPKKFISHQVILDTMFPINCSKNIKMMPNIHFDVPSHILVHESHEAYNHYIYMELERLKNYELEQQRVRLYLFVMGLNDRLNTVNCLPWKKL